MTRYSVQRFRTAVLLMYLRIAIFITLPLSVLCFLFMVTPDRGLLPFVFTMFALWLRRRTRHGRDESQNHSGWFVLVVMCLMIYGAYISNEQLHQEAWMMIFPVAFAPIVAARERIIWIVVSAVSLASVVLLRPEPLSTTSAFMFVAAYLTLAFVTMMLVRHNEQNIERLAHLTMIDPLTKAYNRGYLKDVMVSEVNRCRRSGLSLTVIMLDIDYFKMFNDNYGHLYGDSVLEQVAESLKHSAQRAGDYVFRYGGEEFCIVASGLNRDEAGQFTEKLRLGICALNIENQRSPFHHLTASAGFWCASDLSEITPSGLLMNADNALYRAKAAGRNTVVDFDEILSSEIDSAQTQSAPA